MDSQYNAITNKKNLCLKVERSGEQASAGRFKCALEAIHHTQCSLITLHSDDQPLLHNTMLLDLTPIWNADDLYIFLWLEVL